MSNQLIVQLNPDAPPTGSDLGVVNAARKSFGRRSEWVDGTFNALKPADRRLLEFLARGMTADDFDAFLNEFPHCVYENEDATNGADYEVLKQLLWEWRNTPSHDTPFNHGFFSFEIKVPIFVMRHLVKHEYLILSEYSRRYITEEVEFWRHDYRQAAEDKKQGSGERHMDCADWQSYIAAENMDILEMYNRMIAAGIAPEQARGHLPQDLMTSATWSGTLGAFAKMARLRLANDTQYETRLVAQKLYEHMKVQFPVSAPLLVEGVL